MAVSTQAPFHQADCNHLLIMGMFGALVPSIAKYETVFQLRLTNTVDNIVWNSIAANSENLLALRYGISKVASEPLVRSDVSTTDARVVTAVHAVAAALPLLLPEAETDFRSGANVAFQVVQPTIGFSEDLVAKCGSPDAIGLQYDPACLQDFFKDCNTPSCLGQAVAFEAMHFKLHDRWNALGDKGGCQPVGDKHFCPAYADYTKWHPEAGECTQEALE